MRQYFLYFFLVAFSIKSASSQFTTVDRVLAVVGDNIILQSEIDAQYLQMLAQENMTEAPDAKCRILESLMLEKLFISQAQIDSVVSNPDEVDAELDRRIKYFISIFGSREKLEEYYGKSVLQLKDDFRDDISKQLVADKMRSKAFSGLKVSPAEVKAFFEEIPKDSIPYFNSELELGELVMFPKLTEEEKDYAKKKIQKIRQDIIKGADFSLQAILYSEDPGSASEGGNLGVVERGELVPEFEAVAFRLKEGELSEVTETPFGFHLIIVDEKRGDKLKMRHILVKAKTTSKDLAIVKITMDSVLHQLQVDSMTWREAVKQFSEDEQSKSIGGMMVNPKTGTSFFEKADIDGTLIFTIDRMKIGEYSDVLPYPKQMNTGEIKQGYRIIWLKSETKPHRASLETDYSKIQAATKASKQQKALERWIELHVDKNFVKIDDSVKNCVGLQRWIKNQQ
jgi:peptidyl-prolyl cis-trans isomerase SurA